MGKYRVQRNFNTFYIVTSQKGTRSTQVVTKIGTIQQIIDRTGTTDPRAWANEYAANYDPEGPLPWEEEVGDDGLPVGNEIEVGEGTGFNVGYLFLKRIFYGLGLHKACKYLKQRHPKVTFDINKAVQLITFNRVLAPSSNLRAVEKAQAFGDEFEGLMYQHVMRSLPLLHGDMEYLQRFVYKASKGLVDRDLRLVLYDCTNYWFEVDSVEYMDDELRRFSRNNKAHNGKPCVGVGMAVDASGIPICMEVFPGSMNEQLTVDAITGRLKKMGLDGFVFCADAGLMSLKNRTHLRRDGISYVGVMSIKKMSAEDRGWCLDPKGWSCHIDASEGRPEEDLTGVDLDERDEEKDWEVVFFKEKLFARKFVEVCTVTTSPDKEVSTVVTSEKKRLTDEDQATIDRLVKLISAGKTEEARKLSDEMVTAATTVEKPTEGDMKGCVIRTTTTTYLFCEKMVVTFSFKYKKFLEERRLGAIERAKQKIEVGACEDKGFGSSRYIERKRQTGPDGKPLPDEFVLNQRNMEVDEASEGFYAVTCTWDYGTREAVSDNRERWRSENLFGFTKSGLEARPVFVRKKEHILAHMLVVFLASTLFYMLKKLMHHKEEEGDEVEYTETEVFDALRGLNLTKKGKGGKDGYCLHCTEYTPAMGRLNKMFPGLRFDQRDYTTQTFGKIRRQATRVDKTGGGEAEDTKQTN